MTYQRRILVTALGAYVPVALIALLLAWLGQTSERVRWSVTLVAVAGFLVTVFALADVVTYPLRTLSNLVTALREEDYSLRARNASREDALGDILLELNALADLMESRKLEAVEAAALLRAVMAEIDAAIFAFDDTGQLKLVNRAAERLLATPRERILRRSAHEVGLADLLDGDGPRIIERAFPGATGRWDVRYSLFRERGERHTLVVVADITRALREEEAEAWRRIVRVIGHELNNSLAPVKSIATSVDQIVGRDPLPDDWRDDVTRGMRVIATRADSLTRFTRAYAQLARLPQPEKRELHLAEIVRRVAALETRVRVVVADGADVVVSADADQIEQALINLIRNAAEASMETGGGVRVALRARRSEAEVLIEDEGRGLAGSANLFVPFFTTKAGGTGIGLVLSRQIAEAHGGALTLENRSDGRGCIARLSLPLRE